MYTEACYTKLIGSYVYKESKKPFKSGKKINKVKSIINHPQLNIPAFTFEEDDSYVECRRCCKMYECIRNTTLFCPHEIISGNLCTYCKIPDILN